MWATIRERAPLVLFGSLFVAVGAGATYHTTSEALQQRRHAATLVAAECTITRHEVDSHVDSDGDTMYRPVVHYVHTVGQTRHEGHRIGFSSSSASMRSYAEGVLKNYPVGTRWPCWYDPQDPSDVVLDRSTAGHSVALLPLGFAFVGLAVIVSAFTRSRTSRDGLASRAHWSRGKAGPLVLRPRREHLFDVLLSGGFATCFGLGGVAILGMAWTSGSVGTWLMALLFAATGLGLTLWFLRNLLRVLGPRPRLTLDEPTLRPGGSVQLHYRVGGPALGLFGKISLVGQEEATYTEGTRSVTDTREFYRAELVPLRRTSRSGRATLSLPPYSMHSLHTDHNRIVWLIEVQAILGPSWWPDLDETYEIGVEPAQVES